MKKILAGILAVVMLFTTMPVYAAESGYAAENKLENAGKTEKMYKISVTGELIYDQSQRFADLVNAEREKLGMQPLILDQEMMEAASVRAIEGSVAFGHFLPNDVYSRNDERYNYTTENAGVNRQGTAESFFEGWKNSPMHWIALTCKEDVRLGFVIYHQEGNNKDFYGYAVLTWDDGRPGSTLIPYDGPWGRKTVHREIDIVSKLLLMETREYGIRKGSYDRLKAIYGTTDTDLNGGRDPQYDYGTGWLDNSCGTWESSQPSVAAVDGNGKVTALSEGTAVIRFYVNGDRDKYFQAVIEVRDWKSPDELPYENDKTDTDNASDAAEAGAGQKEAVRPQAPILKAAPYKQQYAKLTWKKPANAKGYQIYCASSRKGKYTCIKTITNGKTAAHTRKLGFGKTRYFKIRAYNVKRNGTKIYSAFSPAVQLKTAPSKVTVTRISSKKKRTATLRWKKSSGAEGYQIYRAVSKKGKYRCVKTVTKGKTVTYTDRKLRKGKRYYYKVRAYRKNGKTKVYGSFSKAKGVRVR